MQSDQHVVVIDSKPGKWRLECPEGHKNWRVWDSRFSCVSCRRQLDTGSVDQSIYDHLVDTKTGREITREELVLNVDVGQPAASR